MKTQNLIDLFTDHSLSHELKTIAEKVHAGARISEDEGIMLFEKADLGYLGCLANFIREKRHGDKTFFNRNFHIEPTNICIYNCTFCSYSRKANEEGSWDYSIEEILEKVKAYKDTQVTEVHVVGGVHPQHDLHYYGTMLQKIKAILPGIHIKAFTAVELEYMIKKAGMSLEEGLLKLKEYGLDSIPGGGAEIFNSEIRTKVCDEKAGAEQWLTVHEKAHKAGLHSNATILYGHIENYYHRIDHMNRLRNLQDLTGMFNAFIPLKYKKKDNKLSHIGEVTTIEDLKNYAVSRIFLDNFSHIKAYWPMIGKVVAQIALSFGVDDIDGTIDDSTKIYTMAGADEDTPIMRTNEIVKLIKDAKKTPVERDTLYNIIKIY